MLEVETISSCGRAVSCGSYLRLAARAAQPVEQTAEFYRIRIGQFRADMLFDRGGIGAPHLLLQLAPGLGDFDELTALVNLALPAPPQSLVDQPFDQP